MFRYSLSSCSVFVAALIAVGIIEGADAADGIALVSTVVTSGTTDLTTELYKGFFTFIS